MSKRLEILGELPSSDDIAQRIRAKHRVLGREVELRMAREAGRDGSAACFVQEMLELSYLDHPVFPPVLDRGVFQGRYFYAVPRRGEASLAEQLTAADGGLGPAQRRRVVWQLASALAATHMAGILLPPPHLEDLTWDPTHELLRWPSPRAPRPAPPEYLAGAEVERADLGQGGPAATVGQWAALAYAVLGDGGGPFRPDAAPPADQLAGADGNLVGIVDGCLYGEPETRPADAAEVLVLLQVASPTPETTAGTPASGGSRPQLAADALRTHQDLRKTLQDLRSAGAIPRPDAREAFGEVVGKIQDRLAGLELPSFEAPSATPRAVAAVAAIVLLAVWFLTAEPAPPPPRRWPTPSSTPPAWARTRT